MRNAQVFKKRYILLIIFLGVLGCGIYKFIQFSPLEQTVIEKISVNDLINLYITENSAGATTDFSYRFYLFDSAKSDAEFIDKINDDYLPFLITSDRYAFQKIERNSIYLSIKGHIFEFHNFPSCRVNNSLLFVPVYLTSTPF